MAETFDHVRKHQVGDIGFVDAEGIARATLNTPEPPRVIFLARNIFTKASSPIDDKPVLEFIDLPGVHSNGGYGVVIAMPIYSDEDEFGGVILSFLKLHDLSKVTPWPQIVIPEPGL